VTIGLIMGSGAKSINDIWGWLVMSLMAGSLAPSLLRLYWWRFNGWGVAAGTAFGGAAAVIQRAVAPDMAEWQQFLMVGCISFASSIGVSLLTRPTAKATLDHFYRTTRPFGFWGPVRASLSGNERKLVDKENFFDIISVPFAMLAQVTLYLLPMQLILGTYRAFGITLVIFLVGAVGTYFLWYKRLPAANSAGLETVDSAAAADH
jgi:solute:Na+ symporter, SSS family